MKKVIVSGLKTNFALFKVSNKACHDEFRRLPRDMGYEDKNSLANVKSEEILGMGMCRFINKMSKDRLICSLQVEAPPMAMVKGTST